MVEHRSVVRLVQNSNFVVFDPGDRFCKPVPWNSMPPRLRYGVSLNGITLCLIGKDDLVTPVRLKAAVRCNRITTMWMTAPLFNRMLQEDIEIFKGLNNLLVGGDVLSPTHIRRLKETYPGLNVINGYGPTENTTFSTTYAVELPIAGSIPIGRPIANSNCLYPG